MREFVDTLELYTDDTKFLFQRLMNDFFHFVGNLFQILSLYPGKIFPSASLPILYSQQVVELGQYSICTTPGDREITKHSKRATVTMQYDYIVVDQYVESIWTQV